MTPEARLQFYAPESDVDTVLLITITGPTIVSPVRLSNNFTVRLAETDEDVTYGIVSRGNPYTFVPMNVVVPGDGTSQAPRGSITLENVSRDLISIIRNVDGDMSVLIELVLKSTPNVVEISWPNMRFEKTPHNTSQINLALAFENLERELFPSKTVTPQYFASSFSQ